MTSIQAVEFLSNCRNIHQEWVDFIKEHPEEVNKSEPVIETAGDIEHHTILVNKYNEVISLLESVNV